LISELESYFSIFTEVIPPVHSDLMVSSIYIVFVSFYKAYL